MLHKLFLSSLPVSHFCFHFVPTYSTPLVTFKKKYIHTNYSEKPYRDTSNDLLGEREIFGEKVMERDRYDCVYCAKHRHTARRTQHCFSAHWLSCFYLSSKGVTHRSTGLFCVDLSLNSWNVSCCSLYWFVSVSELLSSGCTVAWDQSCNNPFTINKKKKIYC